MGTIPKPIWQIIEDYVKRVSKDIPVQKVILFGSYAKGNFKKDSDIDLAIFSNYFQDMNRVDGIIYLLTEAADYNIDLEPQPFTLDEYDNPIGIVEEIIKTGIEIPIH